MTNLKLFILPGTLTADAMIGTGLVVARGMIKNEGDNSAANNKGGKKKSITNASGSNAASSDSSSNPSSDCTSSFTSVSFTFGLVRLFGRLRLPLTACENAHPDCTPRNSLRLLHLPTVGQTDSCLQHQSPSCHLDCLTSSPSSSGFAVGQSVLLFDLVSRADLNGKIGKVRSFDASDLRYAVDVVGSSNPVRVHAKNIRISIFEAG